MSACVHCGLPLAAGPATPVDGDPRFCCHGCAAAHDLLARCGLETPHAGLRHAALAAGGVPRPVPAVGDAPAEWAAPAFLAEVAVALGDGRHAIAWAVEGLHCPACTWVLERLPFLDAGIARAEVDLGRGVLRTVHRADATDPRRIAALAATLGYRLRPWAGAGEDRRRRLAARREALRAAVALACAIGSMQLAMNLAAGELTGDLAAGPRLAFALGALLLALPAGTWAVGPWWRALGRALRHGRWSLDASAALVVALGLGASLVGLLRGSNATYADAVALFCALLLCGRLALHQVQDRLAVQASHLGGLLPDLPPAVGDEVVYATGQRIGGDGLVVAADGCALDVAVLTGESRPQPLASGQTAHAGALVVAGTCTVRIAASGAHTRVARLLAAAEAAAPAAAAPPAWERWYGPALLALAAVAGAGWGMDRAVAVVMAACPCAIGLAVPLARARALAAARGRGLLLRGADSLARLRTLRRAVFDKTGTLTTGRPAVVAWEWLVPEDRRPLLAGAIAAAERACRHPIALAVERHLGAVPAVAVADVRERPGVGLTARWADRALAIGPHGGGHQVTIDGVPVARFQVVDGLRPDAAPLLATLRQRGWTLAIASGDAPSAVRTAADTLGIADAHAALLPEDKAALVDATTLMVGDGVNDAAALAAAGVSVAVRGGLAAGLACADVVVTDETTPLTAVGELLRAADRLAAIERRLLLLTVGYNVIAVGAAALGLWGPLVCAIGMPLSSLAALALVAAWRPFGGTQPTVPAGMADAADDPRRLCTALDGSPMPHQLPAEPQAHVV